jgi:hypothetical protein
MSGAPGIIGADAAAVDLELRTHITNEDGDIKNISQAEVTDIGKAEEFSPADSEPVTSRFELWAWYGYYFGNNSAGTLSYAPLSMLLPSPQSKSGSVLNLVTSLPVASQPSRLQRQRSHPGLQRRQCSMLGRLWQRHCKHQLPGADLQRSDICPPGCVPDCLWVYVRLRTVAKMDSLDLDHRLLGDSIRLPRA